MNVALSRNGGSASASTIFSSAFSPAGTINGLWAGAWGNDVGGWNSNGGGSWPQTLDITFNATYAIAEIVVVTLQDSPSSTVEPDDTTTFASYGIVDFLVQTWDGSSWVTIPGGTVTGNNHVVRRFALSPAISTSKIRISVSNVLAGDARITEVEANTASGGSSLPKGFTGAGRVQ